MTQPRIISISGFIASGKDTVADYLCTHHGFKRVSFAGALKDAASSIFGWDREMVEGSTKASREWREQVDTWWAQRLGMPHLTPRWVLQNWGTELFRNHFHQDIWVASVENRLRQSKNDVVITDARFANEVYAIKNSGGTTIRVTRGPLPDWHDAAVAYNKGELRNTKWAVSKRKLDELGIHASEYSSVGLKYDHHIDNNGTIDDLHAKVNQLLGHQDAT
jgi:hypothetical protein